MAKFSLFYPLDNFIVTQGFGSNGAYYQANGINIKGHNGLDLLAYHGQPIYAAHDGTAYYERDDNQGHGVVIVTGKSYDYKNGQAWFKSIAWHMCDPIKEPRYASQIYLAVGSVMNSGKGIPVKAGDQIGWADNTGLSTGDHCHFGLKPVTSGKATSNDAPDVGVGDWVNIEQLNGYLGAIDPTPYFSGQYASQAQKVIANLTAQISAYQQVVELLKKLLLIK